MADFRRRLIFEVEDRQFQKHRSDLNAYAGESERQIGRVGRAWDGLKTKIAAALSTAAIGMFVRSLVRVNSALEQTQVRFETLLGSASAANRMIRDLYAFSARTPFEFEGLADAAQALLGFGANADEVVDHLQLLGDVAAGTGGSLERMADIYGRAMVRGRMTGNNLQDLVRQGIPIYQELANATGRAADEIEGMVSRGEVRFHDLQQAFRNLTKEGGLYFGSLERGSQTMQGMISTLQTLRTQLMQDIGRGLFENLRDDLEAVTRRATELHESGRLAEWGSRAGEAIRTLYERLRTVAEFLAQYGSTIVRVTAVMAAWRAATIAMTAAKGALNAVVATGRALFTVYHAGLILVSAAKYRLLGQTKAVTIAMRAFNTVVRANPVGILVSALAAAVTAFLVFRRRTDDAAEGIKEIERNARDAKRALQDMDGAMLYSRELELGEQRPAINQRIRGLRTDLERVDRTTFHGGIGTQEQQRERRRLEIQAKINEETARLAAVNGEIEAIHKRVNSDLNASIGYLTAQRDALVSTGRETDRIAELNEQITAAQEEQQRLQRLGIVQDDPPEITEEALKALDAFERIRRAVALTQAATDDWRQALQDAWTAQDAIATLQATLPHLSGSQLAEAERMLEVLSRQLSEAQEVVGAEERRAAAIRDAAEATNRLQKLAAMPLAVLDGDALRAEEARVKVDAVSAAIRAYEATVTRLRNELAAGVKDQDQFAAAMDAANREAMAALKEVYTQLSAMGALTPQMETLFRQLFSTIEDGADASADAIGDLSTQLQNVGASIRSMTRLLDVFGDLRRETRMLLDGLADLADNAGRFVETWNRLGDARGSLGGVLSLAVPGIGMVAGLASSIAGLIGSNKEQRREMERLRDSLREMGRSVRESAAQMMQAATIGSGVTQSGAEQALRNVRQLLRGDALYYQEAVNVLRRVQESGVPMLDNVVEHFEGIWRSGGFQSMVSQGILSQRDAIRQAMEQLFGGGTLASLEMLVDQFGQAGQSIEGAIDLFDLLTKAGMGVEDAWQRAGQHILDNVTGLSDEVDAWLQGLLSSDLTGDAFREAVQDMLMRMADGSLDLGGMTPDAFRRLTDWLLSIPGQIDAPADTTTDLADVFQRLGIRQEFRDMDAQQLFDAFLGDLSGEDLGDVINDFITSMLDDALDVTDAVDMDSLRTNLATFAQLIEQGAIDLSQVGEDQFLQIMRVLRGFADGIEDVTAEVVEEIDAFGDAVSRLRMRQEFRQQSPQELYDAFLSDLEGLDLSGQLAYRLAMSFRGLDLDDPAVRERMLANIDRMWQSFEAGRLDIGDLSDDDFVDLLRVLRNFADGVEDVTADVVDEINAFGDAVQRLRMRQEFRQQSPQELYDAFLSDLGGIDLGGQLGYWMSRTFGEIDLDDPAARDRMLDNIDRMWQLFEDGALDIGDLSEDDFADLLRVLRNFADGVEDLTAGLYDTLDGAMADLSIRLGIIGTDVAEALDAFVRAVLAASVDIPDAARALVDEAGSLDLSTAEGRERLQEIIAAIGAMMLGETDADMRDALQTIVQGLGQIAQAAPVGEDRTSRSVQYLRTITEFQGQEIVLILDALEHWARQQLAQLEIIAGHTAALAGLEAAVQSAMAGAMPSFDAATIESLTNNRTINLRFGDLNLTRALSDPEDVDALAEAFAHRFRDILRERY